MDKLIQTAGSSALPVLIQGAVGTHKGVVARRIHTKSATEGTTLMLPAVQGPDGEKLGHAVE